MIPLATGYVSCEFMCYPNHTGIDLANYGDTSTPVYAAQAGTVIRAGWHSAYGNHVMITHNVNGQILTTVYAHMHSAPYVSVGQQVSRGTQLGTMGNTGNSFGAHLHLRFMKDTIIIHTLLIQETISVSHHHGSRKKTCYDMSFLLFMKLSHYIK